MDKTFDISVVLGSKNRKGLIKATINSIRNNGFPGSIEIIVIDGGSVDGTCDWLAKQKDVFTIIQPNYSIERDGIKVKAHSWGEFMNIAFKYAHSDYVVMISDDIILAEGCLKKGYDTMVTELRNGNKIGGGAFYFREYPRMDYYRVVVLPNDNININHGFYYRPALESVNWLDEKSYNFYCGDGDIAMRLNLAGWKTIPLPQCFAAHLVHLPKRKGTIPLSIKNDISTFNALYPVQPTVGKLISDSTANIDTKPFWIHGFKNVIAGYLMKILKK